MTEILAQAPESLLDSEQEKAMTDYIRCVGSMRNCQLQSASDCTLYTRKRRKKSVYFGMKIYITSGQRML